MLVTYTHAWDSGIFKLTPAGSTHCLYRTSLFLFTRGSLEPTPWDNLGGDEREIAVELARQEPS